MKNKNNIVCSSPLKSVQKAFGFYKISPITSACKVLYLISGKNLDFPPSTVSKVAEHRKREQAHSSSNTTLQRINREQVRTRPHLKGKNAQQQIKSLRDLKRIALHVEQHCFFAGASADTEIVFPSLIPPTAGPGSSEEARLFLLMIR